MCKLAVFALRVNWGGIKIRRSVGWLFTQWAWFGAIDACAHPIEAILIESGIHACLNREWMRALHNIDMSRSRIMSRENGGDCLPLSCSFVFKSNSPPPRTEASSLFAVAFMMLNAAHNPPPRIARSNNMRGWCRREIASQFSVNFVYNTTIWRHRRGWCDKHTWRRHMCRAEARCRPWSMQTFRNCHSRQRMAERNVDSSQDGSGRRMQKKNEQHSNLAYSRVIDGSCVC